MSEVITVQDLETLKKHEIFEAEVITGKVGGLATGVNIDYATNAATGQTQKTLPAILRGLGFEPASFDFATGGTLGVNDRNKAVLWPLAGGGDGFWYNWEGALPKVIPPASSPASTGGVANGAWRVVGDLTLRSELAAANGSTLVGFIQAGTGAVPRTAHDKMREVISVKDFGAVGDGVADDTVAVQTAADTGVLYFPAGVYKVSGTITLPATRDVAIFGDGRGRASVLYTGTGTLFSAAFTDSIRFAEVSDIRLLANTLVATTKAVHFSWPEDFEHGFVQRVSFSNVSIRGLNEYENGFNTCVHIHQGDNANFINCEFKGAGGGVSNLSQAYNTRSAIGVYITGRFSPVEYRVKGCYFGSFDTAIKVEDTAEGIYVENSIAIACKIGVYWTTGFWSDSWPGVPGGNASGRPLLSIHNSHFNFYQYGVFTDGVVSIHERDLLLYHNDNATQNGIAIAHTNGTEIFINTIEVWGFNATYFTDGVVFVGGVTNSAAKQIRTVTGAANAVRYGVEIRSGCSKIDVYDVTRRSTGGTFVGNKAINDLTGGVCSVGVRGGLFYATAAQSVSSGPTTIVNYGARDYDPENLWSGGGGNIVIPDGVNKVRVSGGVLFDSAVSASTRELFFLMNGSAARGMGQQSTTSVIGRGTYLNVVSGVVFVTPGDIFTMNVRHDDGVNRALQANLTWMQLEILA